MAEGSGGENVHALVRAVDDMTKDTQPVFVVVETDHPTTETVTITLKDDPWIKLGLAVTKIADEVGFDHNCAEVSAVKPSGRREILFWHSEGKTKSIIRIRAPTLFERWRLDAPVVELRWAVDVPHKNSKGRLSIWDRRLDHLSNPGLYPPSCRFVLARGPVPDGYLQRGYPRDLASRSLGLL
jgi:hypothetical protein